MRPASVGKQASLRDSGGMAGPGVAALVDEVDPAFRARVAEECKRAHHFGRPVSLMAVRHQGVDDGVCEQRLRKLLRSVDHLHPVGASMWLALLPEADIAHVRELAARIRHDLPTVAAMGAAVGTPEQHKVASWMASAVGGAQAAGPGELRVEQSVRTVEEPTIVVMSECMQSLYALVRQVASTTMPVLVQGETGTGKELVARSIHDGSRNRNGAFCSVNCAALPANLLEATLFGHEKGAFTGADRQSLGLFERAHGGTLFLDEIGELPPPAQAALLRVLETGSFLRVGGQREIQVNVRVVAATHRDLGSMAARGEFREDLMYRLAALLLRVPPLRERPEEVGALSDLFLDCARAKWGARATSFSETARGALGSYPWPGNVRQLRHVVERAAAICLTDTIDVHELLLETALTPRQETRQHLAAAATETGPLVVRVRAFEAAAVRDALATVGGNHTKAALLLGLPRRTLVDKIRAYGLGGKGLSAIASRSLLGPGSDSTLMNEACAG